MDDGRIHSRHARRCFPEWSERISRIPLHIISTHDCDPLRATTYGTGELILAALNAGIRRFLIGLGGSATNDGGAGMVQALGGHWLDAQGRELGFGGGLLEHLARIDVDHPLIGPQGASAIFSAQKGATPDIAAQLDRNLSCYAERIHEALGLSVANTPGGGAAGGLGAGLLAFLKARLRPGIEIITEAVGLDQIIADADLVITGEGRNDGQTVHGKTPIGVARVAARHGKPVIAIAGCLMPDAAAVYGFGIAAIFSAVPQPCSLADALAAGAENVRAAARDAAAAHFPTESEASRTVVAIWPIRSAMSSTSQKTVSRYIAAMMLHCTLC